MRVLRPGGRLLENEEDGGIIDILYMKYSYIILPSARDFACTNDWFAIQTSHTNFQRLRGRFPEKISYVFPRVANYLHIKFHIKRLILIK